MRQIPIKSDGDFLEAAEFNDVAEELENAIQGTGIVLTSTDLSQLGKSIANYVASSDYYTDNGTANAYVLNGIGAMQNPTVYVDGFRVRFKPANTNTGISTVNVTGIGNKEIKKVIVGTPTSLSGGEIKQNQVIELNYNASSDWFEIISATASTTSLLNFCKKISGILLSNNISNPNTQIDFSSGYFIDSIISNTFFNASTLTKRLDAVWAEGSGNGGRASGVTLSPSTWYHCFMLGKSDGTVDAGFDTDINCSNLLATATGYTSYKRNASILTDGSSNIISFVMSETGIGRFVQWSPLQGPITLSVVNFTTDYLYAVATPPGIEIMANIIALTQSGNYSKYYTVISSPNVTSSGTSGTILTAQGFLYSASYDAGPPITIDTGKDSIYPSTNLLCQTNSNKQLRFRHSHEGGVSPTGTMFLWTIGWYEEN
jgi:hypothetical protein